MYSSKCYGFVFILGVLNARIFGNVDVELDPFSNRSLLLEFCNEHSCLVANTVFEKPADELVTYRGWGLDRFADVHYRDFA